MLEIAHYKQLMLLVNQKLSIKTRNKYKASNHYKNIMKNQDSTQSPKKPRVRVIKVYGGGSGMAEDLTDPTEKIDQYTKGGKHGGLAKRGYGIARHPRKT